MPGIGLPVALTRLACHARCDTHKPNADGKRQGPKFPTYQERLANIPVAVSSGDNGSADQIILRGYGFWAASGKPFLTALKQANRATIAVTRQFKTVRAKYRRPDRTAQQAGRPLLADFVAEVG